MTPIQIQVGYNDIVQEVIIYLVVGGEKTGLQDRRLGQTFLVCLESGEAALLV